MIQNCYSTRMAILLAGRQSVVHMYRSAKSATDNKELNKVKFLSVISGEQKWLIQHN